MSAVLSAPATHLLADYKDKQQTLSANVQFLAQGMPQRKRLEDFISHVYKKYYNAHIENFYPNLISIETNSADNAHVDNAPFEGAKTQQSIKAVAGVRCANHEALFSEYYLNNSLESELERVYQQPIDRQYIVEVGNLAPESIGQMRWLITTITGFLHSAGYKYIVFTLVPGIYNAFKRMNIPLEFLAQAKHEALPRDIQCQWGAEYYQKKPVVLVGDIAQGFDIVKENVYQSNKNLIPLFEQACYLGKQISIKKDLQETLLKEQVA